LEHPRAVLDRDRAESPSHLRRQEGIDTSRLERLGVQTLGRKSRRRRSPRNDPQAVLDHAHTLFLPRFSRWCLIMTGPTSKSCDPQKPGSRQVAGPFPTQEPVSLPGSWGKIFDDPMVAAVLLG